MSLNGTVWAPIGPSPMNEGSGEDNGLVTAIAVNPNNNNVIFLGTAGGGVWRSDDGGNTWTPVFDQQPVLGIGEPGGIAIDPGNTDTIYVGTSARDQAIEPATVDQPTAGLFKSTDGGASWIQLGSGYPASNTGNAWIFIGQTINVIIVDPADSNVVYLSSSAGVYTSANGGQSWTQATGIGGDSRALVLDPTSPPGARILYAGLDGNGVFRSTNGGASFTQVLGPAVLGPAAGARNIGRVAVALAPPTAVPNVNGIQVIYTAVSAGYNQTDPIGLFLSINQGGTWTQQNATGITGTTYGGYAMDIAVDPASPGDGLTDTVFYGCQNQFISTDAGGTFSPINVGHADVHTWTCVPQPGGTPTVVYCGSDGGIDVSTNGGTTWLPRNKGGLQTGLFYNIAINPTSASVTVGALQDNSIQTATAPPGWTQAFGGDGWDVAYDGSGTLYATSGGPATSVESSTNNGITFTGITPPWTAVDTGGFLLNQVAADPSAPGTIYVSGNQNLWQRLSGTWRIIAAPGSSGNVDVAPTNGNHVVIGAGSQVYVSTNALATGVAFTNITANLPGRTVARAVFDPVDPNMIYAVLDGFSDDPFTPQNVFWTTIGSGSWTNISPPVDLPCGAIAVDGTTTPTTLYVGTDYGVLCSTDLGASWSVLDEIHFPKVPVFDLAFNAQAGVLRAATYGRGVFQFGQPTGPAIAVGLQDGLAFGTVCPGSGTAYLTLTVYNVGVSDLVITNVERLFGSADFTVLPTPATPLTVSPGEEVTFTIAFAPTGPAGVTETATIRIISNDPTAPFVDVPVTGVRGAGKVATVIADSGDFGNVCLGSFADEVLTINNSGDCLLSISGILTSLGFLPPSVVSYPLRVGPGDSIDVPIRFQPTTSGLRTGTITVFSDDPASPASVSVRGTGRTPKANLVIADSGNFGRVCVGSFADEALLVTNSGHCTLTVTGITSNSSDFLVPLVLSYPITVGPGDALPVPIRFQPTGFGPKSATIMVASDDPASPLSVDVFGDAPPGKLAVTGSTTFGGVSAGCCADRTISVCNVGDCALHVKSVHLRRRSRHWKLLNNPFPAKLHPGSCLPVVLQYHADERRSRICELVIESDDPETPERIIEVSAYTIRDQGCGEDCDDCRRGGCERHHCWQGYPCGCEDDDDRDEDR
jgi:hypothetical protein